MPFGNARTQGFNSPAILNFDVDNVKINPQGIFIYSASTPAPNNLIQSIVFGTVSVTDSAGNVALPGDTTYVHDGATYQAENRYQGVINWYSAATEAGPWTVGTGIDGRDGEINIGNGLGTVQLVTEDVAGAYANGAFVVNFPNQLNASGIAIVPTGILALITHQPETWHNVTLDAGWSTTANYSNLQYRLTANGDIQFTGSVSHTSITATTQINSGNPLPVLYRPPKIKTLSDGNSPLGRLMVEYRTDGILYALANASAPGTIAEVDASVTLLA